jgi:hypothetical protein
MNRQEYKGCVIEANPKELADGSGWTEDYNIEIHHGDRVDVRPIIGQRTLASKNVAIRACIEGGKHRIDESILLR